MDLFFKNSEVKHNFRAKGYKKLMK